MTIVVNLFGGPGTGKSTTAAGVFNLLKKAGINAELVDEYAKGVVWEESFKKLENQLYIFAKQQHKIQRCLGKVDVIVTDSPVNLGLVYGHLVNGHLSDELANLIKYEFDKCDNFNVFLIRKKAYNPKGRTQTEDEAKEVDDLIQNVLIEHEWPHITLDCEGDVEQVIADMILKLLKND